MYHVSAQGGHERMINVHYYYYYYHVVVCRCPVWDFLFHPQPPYKQIAQSCNLWRNYDDIGDSWSSVTGIMSWFAEDQGNFTQVAGPGNWNDPDMVSGVCQWSLSVVVHWCTKLCATVCVCVCVCDSVLIAVCGTLINYFNDITL